MARRPKRSLRPAFVVVAALAGAACGPLEGTFLDPSPDKDNPDEDRCCTSVNPPMPEPVPPPAPKFGPTISQADPPPALGAATLVTEGNLAIGSDPDRDRVVIVDVPQKSVKTVALTKGDEPGRIALDGLNRAHVVLRGAGSIASINLQTGTVIERRAVCAAPRGITFANAKLFVACAGGELVSLPVSGGASTLVTKLDRDLRDIVPAGAGPETTELFISRMRSAEVLVVGVDGKLVSRRQPPTKPRMNQPPKSSPREPGVAWRMVKTAQGVRLLHQAANPGEIDLQKPAAYASIDPCGGPVVGTTSTFTTTTSEIGPLLGDAVVPVDLAVSPDGSRYAVIAAGNAHIEELSQVQASQPGIPNESCMVQLSSQRIGLNARFPNMDPPGEHVAAAFQSNDTLLVLSREPAALHVRGGTEEQPTWTTISLGGASKRDTGHAILHSNTGFGIACASCHPEGGEDGRTWSFADGLRRTQSLRGTLDGTGPYHWRGDIPDLTSLTKGAFSERMGGPQLAADQVAALAKWLVKIPALPASPPNDSEAAARGKTLFESSTTKCATCHSGNRFTDNVSYDVGTGETLQVPSLVGLAFRAPYMHDGCAKTLLDRFDAKCGGGDKHGTTSQLTTEEKLDLAAYLESL